MKKKQIWLAVCVLVLVFVIAVPTSVLCAGTFIKITGIEGESTDSDHDGWIDVLSYSSSLIQPASAATGTSRSRGAVSMGDITVTKVIDKATPKLNEAMCTGTHIPEVQIEVRGSGQSTIYTLKDVVIQSIVKSGKNEIVKFTFKSGNYAVLLSK